jgi:glycosyl hydrolase family 16
MKKLLLFVLSMLFVTSSAFAGEYTLTFKDNGGTSDNTAAFNTSKDITLVVEESNYVTRISAVNNVYSAKQGYGLKFSSGSKNGSLTFALSTDGAKKITKIVATACAYGSDASKISINGADAQDLTTDFADYTFTFAPTENTTTLKIDATKRMYLTKLVVTYDGGEVSGPASPVVKMGANNTVEISAADGAQIYYTTNGDDPTAENGTLYTAAFTISNATVVKAIAVVDGKSSSVATFNAYLNTLSSLEELIDLGDLTHSLTVQAPMTIVYHNGRYMYVAQDNIFLLLYGVSSDDTYTNGAQLDAVTGSYTLYKDVIPEMTNVTLGNVTEGGTPVDPTAITIAEVNSYGTALMNYFVKLEGVAIDLTNTKLTQDGNELVYYNQFGLTLPEATDGKTYNVEGFMSYHNGNIQLNIINVTEVEIPAGEYETYPADNVINRTDTRYTSNIVLTSDGKEQTISDLQSESETHIYRDATAQVAEFAPGSTVKVTANYVGSWMHGYLWIDYNKDYQFTYELDSNNLPTASSELVGFSNYSTNPNNSGTWHNSNGNTTSGGGGGTPNAGFSFVVPEDLPAGEYRARYIVDYNILDPTPQPTRSDNTLEKNGGMVADFTIRVTAPTKYTVTIASAEHGTIKVLNGENEITSGSQVNAGTVITIAGDAERGYMLGSATVNGTPIEGFTYEVNEDVEIGGTFVDKVASYTAPAGHVETNGTNTYVETINTTGAAKDMTAAFTEQPTDDNIYALIEDKAEVVPGESFTLNLIAKSLGEYSTSTIRQDIRYTCAYIWADWYGLSEWEKVQFHGTVPPSHNVGGNYDVLNIAQALTMPADVPVGTEGRIRVIYSSAWSVPGTNSSDQNQGMEAADPNSQYINGGIAYDIVVNAVAAPVPTYAVTIAETEATVEANVEDLTAVEEGTEVTFTITAPEGKQIASVTYNDETITANEDGTYTITVNADGTLSVTLEDIPQPGKALLVPSANGRNIYTFRIDDAVLGSHTNGSCDANDLRSHNFTYSAWINIKNTTSGPIMGNIQSQFIDATGAFVVSLKDGKLNLSGRGNTSDSGYANEQPSATETTDPGTANDEWVFVSVVADREAKTVTLYKNCKAISHYDVTNKIGLLPDKSSFFIGGNGTSVEFTEVQLWNKALTPDELMDSYNLKFTETPENLAAYYKPAELVESSTTDLRNLGTVGTDVPGQLLMGTSSYDSSQWTYVYNGTPQDIELIDEDRVLGTAAITLVQPTTEGNSFKVTDAKGKEIAAEVTLFEKLNVVPALAEGVEVLGVIVEADGVKTTYTLDQFPIRATGDMTISLRLNDLFKVIATAENGTVTISVNDGEAIAVAAEGTEVAKGSKVVLTFTGNEGTEFKSLTVNGEDAQLTDGTYTIDAIDADYTLAAIYDLFTYKLIVINPYDDDVPENNVYGEFVDNQMNRLDYEDENGLEVTPGSLVYLSISNAENHGTADSYYIFDKLTDNGQEVTTESGTLFPNGDLGYIYIINGVQEDHTIVISQNLYSGIIGVVADAEGMISFADYTIRVAADNAQIDIFDLNGRTLRSVAANEITVSDLVKGVYFAKATVNGKAYTLKFIKL